MFDGIKGALHSITTPRGSAAPLSILPERKTAISFDVAAATTFARNGYPRIAAALLGGVSAWSGEPVSNASSLQLSTVYACNKVISESVGFLPISMMQNHGATNDPATSHPMYSALRNAPNCEITAQRFTELLTSHCVLQGNSYAQIIRRSSTGAAIELQPLLPENVHVSREKTGLRRLIYEVKEANQPNATYTVERGKAQSILHIPGLGWDGLRGYSVIAMARQSLGTALAQERNVAAFYANGGRVPYLLTNDKHFDSDQAFDAFRNDWEDAYSQPHRVPILEDGLKYQQIGMSAADAQLLQSRQFTIPELCRWFGVSPHLVGDLSKATLNNVESLADQFVRFTLMTWLTRWEQELWRCVLTPDEKLQGYFFKHDLDALLKADFTARMAGYSILLQNGVDSINEVRAAEGRNPIAGGDEHHVQVNMASLANTNQTRKVGLTDDE